MKQEETKRLLTTLLDDSGVAWVAQMDLIRFRVRRNEMHWEMNCRCEKDRIMVFSRYPFCFGEREQSWKICNMVNATVTRGAMFLPTDGRPVFRVEVDIRDDYDARFRLRETLEFAARMTARFWGDLEAASLL